MRRASFTVIMLSTVVAGVTGQAAELNLFDWMGIAPIVVQGDVRGESGKYVKLQVSRVIRGDLEPGGLIYVDLRKVNRNRGCSGKTLKLTEGKSCLLLLQPAPSRKRPELPTYDLVRGVRGAREVPPEGGEALLSATETLARIQDREDEKTTWLSMRDLLEDTNPILIITSLEHHMKFGRGTPELLQVIRPLLDHPRADLRERAARLIGQILSRYQGRGIPEEGRLHAELAGRARRDRVISVRVAATEALNGLWNEGTEELLEQIARRDPDQLVRYTARKVLYERRVQQEAQPDGS